SASAAPSAAAARAPCRLLMDPHVWSGLPRFLARTVQVLGGCPTLTERWVWRRGEDMAGSAGHVRTVSGGVDVALGMRSVVPGRPGVGGAVRCGVALAAAALGVACVAQAAYGAQTAVTGTVAAAYTSTAGLSSAELAVKPLA